MLQRNAMSRCRHLGAGLLALACGLLPACQQRMAVQQHIGPDQASSFYPDGRASPPLVDGTVARGHLRTDYPYFAGTRTRAVRVWAVPAALIGNAAPGGLGALALAAAQENNYVDTFPLKVTRELIEHGQHRYMIYCVVCHDPLGTGRGTIVERGYTPPASYHIDRLRNAPVGHFFAVISDGYGSMPEHKQQIPVRDRWATATYIRALQLSQHFSSAELTPEMRQEWREQNESASAKRTE
jgi:mono/diheme cytochrome c family protein